MSFRVWNASALFALIFSVHAYGVEPRRCLRDGKVIITNVTCEQLGNATDLLPAPPEKHFQRGQPEKKVLPQARAQQPAAPKPSVQPSSDAMQTVSGSFLNSIMVLLISLFLVTLLVILLKRKPTRETFPVQTSTVSRREAATKAEVCRDHQSADRYSESQSLCFEPTWSDSVSGTRTAQGACPIDQDGSILGRNCVDDQSFYATVARPKEWSLELIRKLEWKRFEDVCQQFFEKQGIRCQTTDLGPDGGIDIRLYQDDSISPTSIAQCKAWGGYVGVKPIRELLGVMTHEKIGKAFFMTSSAYSSDAKAVADANRITLIDGPMLLTMIQRLPPKERDSLLEFATDGDYMTPTCPKCGTKMKAVRGVAGRHDFWGCRNYPNCRQKLGMRRAREVGG